MAALNLLRLPTICFPLFFFFLLKPILAFNDASSASRGHEQGDIGDISASDHFDYIPPPSSSPSGMQRSNFSPFKPSIAVIVGALTTMFSITFLLLLYAKHCKRGGAGGSYGGNHDFRGGLPTTAAVRKNSGIDRTVVESLPAFRFRSLRGHKDGLECAVCLNRFEPTEILRLLPKCKHAFHVECVDTWLDAHSTCPLCRYRVDPEDVLLVDDSKLLHGRETPSTASPHAEADIEARRSATESLSSGVRRVSGRHSSAGEKGTAGYLQIVLETPGESSKSITRDAASHARRSVDSSNLRKTRDSVTVGCIDRPRKDGLLLKETSEDEGASFERRFEHRIIVSSGLGGPQHRWSDVQPSDLLYLRSEMIISDSRRYSASLGSRPSSRQQYQSQQQLPLHWIRREVGAAEVGFDGNRRNGSSVINSRCVSEMTGLSRFSNRTINSSTVISDKHSSCPDGWP